LEAGADGAAEDGKRLKWLLREESGLDFLVERVVGGGVVIIAASVGESA
jgi:hypothetical protein